MSEGLEILVLGPVEAVTPAGRVELTAKQTRLLAALAGARGATRQPETLIEALWPETPPPSAPKLIQVYVSQLRGLLGPSLIETRAAGYALGAAAVDADRFEDLLADGRRSLKDGNPALASSLLARALSLWRGAAYGSLGDEVFLRRESERLEERRLIALEERFEAELALGHHTDVLHDVLALAEAQPLRERLRGQAMLALYRCGRQSDALGSYLAGVRHLRDELGITPGPELRDLHLRVLRQDPALASPAPGPPVSERLPAPVNQLIGRERELAEVGRMLVGGQARLVVLSGAGGSGKTRLALEAARRAAPAFANGAVLVELAPVRQPHLVIPAVLRALAIEEVPGNDPLDTLAAALRPLQQLLILDNFEQVLPAAPGLVQLLARAPRVSLLVTSRAVLHVSGEHVYAVQPLPIDDAVRLFSARAAEADAGFDAQAHPDAIRAICSRLDGLPLAIELAAARARTLPPPALRDRLEPRLPLLTGGPRDLPARQRTLRATLEWSFGLLAAPEARLAARLAVFAGSFDLAEAEVIAGADLDTLASLVEQSLLERAPDGRFVYLETVREFALERLEASADAADTHRRHFDHFRKLADSADLTAVRRLGRERLDVAAAAQDNLRSALAWSVSNGQATLGLELATAMERFWVTHDPREGMSWFAALLARPEAEAAPIVVRANALRAYASATDIAGEDQQARGLYEESLALFEQLEDSEGQAVLLHRLGISALRRGELEVAADLVEASHRLHEQDGNRWGMAQTFGTLGAIERDAGNEDRAEQLIEVSAAMAREVGVRWWESGMLAELAGVSLRAGRLEQAESRARQSLILARELGDRAGCVFGVGLLALVAALQGDSQRAARLWWVVADRDAGAPLGGWRRHREAYRASIQEVLGQAAVPPVQEERLSVEAAIVLALDDRPSHDDAASPAVPATGSVTVTGG